jgi:hypothetical protein
MKHILNNLSEEEKNRIREQYTGGKKIMIENFSQLLNKKLGEVKPLINEEECQNVNDYTPPAVWTEFKTKMEKYGFSEKIDDHYCGSHQQSPMIYLEDNQGGSSVTFVENWDDASNIMIGGYLKERIDIMDDNGEQFDYKYDYVGLDPDTGVKQILDKIIGFVEKNNIKG